MRKSRKDTSCAHVLFEIKTISFYLELCILHIDYTHTMHCDTHHFIMITGENIVHTSVIFMDDLIFHYIIVGICIEKICIEFKYVLTSKTTHFDEEFFNYNFPSSWCMWQSIWLVVNFIFA